MDLGSLVSMLPQVFIDGLTLGFLYAVVALGYTMVYGILELINFAHGEIFMVGAFIGTEVLLLMQTMGMMSGLNPYLALFLALAVAMVFTGSWELALKGLPIARYAHLPALWC